MGMAAAARTAPATTILVAFRMGRPDMSLAYRRGASSPACKPAFVPACRVVRELAPEAGWKAGSQAGLLAPRRHVRLMSLPRHQEFVHPFLTGGVARQWCSFGRPNLAASTGTLVCTSVS